MNHLVELEEKALKLKNSGRIAEAAELFSVIVEQQPDWEHGCALHDLAQCYEDLGRLEEAETLYRRALDYEPTSDIFLGGLASFLYLHGKPEDAFDAHLRLLVSDNNDESIECGDRSNIAVLTALGEKMGWSREFIAKKIEEGMA
jgi:Flp pilus assembly protein TadD